MIKNIFGAMAFLLTIALIASSCKKNEFTLKETELITNKAFLKVNFMSAYKIPYSTQIKVDGNRVSNTLTYATPFPGGGLNTGGGSYADYLAVEPGSRKIDISIPVTGTSTDSVPLASNTITLEKDKFYSLYFADTASNTKALLSLDDNSRPDSGFVRYKFINLIPDVPEGIDLYFGTTKVAGPIAYLGTSPYFNVAINTGTAWSLRRAGGTTAISSYSSASSTTNQRVFTAVARGYVSVGTSTSEVRRAAVSFIYNN